MRAKTGHMYLLYLKRETQQETSLSAGQQYVSDMMPWCMPGIFDYEGNYPKVHTESDREDSAGA